MELYLLDVLVQVPTVEDEHQSETTSGSGYLVVSGIKTCLDEEMAPLL